jgi:catechol 2,3-dioxygenase-like lactoylglutathione lyase family enzyme
MRQHTAEPLAPRWRFDHINLHAAADTAMQRLFVDVMGLLPGHRPPFPFPGQWLYGEAQDALLHVVDAPATQGQAVRLGHIAFRTGTSAPEVLARLDAAGLDYEVAVVPEQGDVQVFVPLPGGLIIELDMPADTAFPQGAYDSLLARTAPDA